MVSIRQHQWECCCTWVKTWWRKWFLAKWLHALHFNLHEINSEREKNFTFYFTRSSEKVWILMYFSTANAAAFHFIPSFFRSKCNLSPAVSRVHLIVPENKKKKCWKRVEGECQQQSIMHEMQQKQGLPSRGAAPCAEKKSWKRKTPEKFEWKKPRRIKMQST